MQALVYVYAAESCFFCSQGRTLDLATCLVSGSGVLLIVSPTQTVPLAQRLRKFILFGDEVLLCTSSSWQCSPDALSRTVVVESCKPRTWVHGLVCRVRLIVGLISSQGREHAAHVTATIPKC